MTNFSMIATLIRVHQTRLLKMNRKEDREATIIANTEAAIHLAEAAASIDKATKVLVPFEISLPAIENTKPRKTGGRGETKRMDSSSRTVSDWSTDDVLTTKSA